MPYLNVKERVLEAKVVYYGAGLSGKTTNLEQVKAGSAEDGRVGEMMSLNTDGDRTLFFDYLPFEIGKLNGLDVKIQLYTVPGQTKYAETRRRVLAGADGVVLVLDSQAGALERNKQTVTDLQDHMRANNLDPTSTPVLVQLNKRDLPTAMDVDALRRECGVQNLPFTEAVACDGKGVFETLRTACKMVLESIKGSARDGRSKNVAAGQGSGLDGQKMHEELQRHVGADGLPRSNGAPSPPSAPAATAASPARSARPSAPVRSPSPPMVAAPAPPASSIQTGGGLVGTVAPATSPSPQNGAPSRAASQGIEAVFRSLRDEIARLNARQDSSPGTGAPPDALRQLVEVQRQVAQRLETLEKNVGAYLQQSIQRIEQRIGSSGPVPAGDGAGGLEAAKQIATKLAGATTALSGKVDGLGQSVGAVQGDLDEVKQRSEALAKGLGDIGRVLAKVDASLQALPAAGPSSAGPASAPPSSGLDARLSALEETLTARLDDLQDKAVTATEVDELVTSVSSMVIAELRAHDEALRERRRREREEGADQSVSAASAVATEATEERIAQLEAKLDTLSAKLDAATGRTAERVVEALGAVEVELRDDLDRFGQEQRESLAKLEAALVNKVDGTRDGVAQVSEELERHAGEVQARFDEVSDQNRSHAQAVETWFGQVLQAVNLTLDELRRGKGKWWKNT